MLCSKHLVSLQRNRDQKKLKECNTITPIQEHHLPFAEVTGQNQAQRAWTTSRWKFLDFKFLGLVNIFSGLKQVCTRSVQRCSIDTQSAWDGIRERGQLEICTRLTDGAFPLHYFRQFGSGPSRVFWENIRTKTCRYFSTRCTSWRWNAVFWSVSNWDLTMARAMKMASEDKGKRRWKLPRTFCEKTFQPNKIKSISIT